ncbi:hypothetical protein E7939_21820 [Salmonella enterica]|nr:hypothetical protein [Salmonella enterica]EAV6370510.1 hypothetical protein [Salmonella enterica]
MTTDAPRWPCCECCPGDDPEFHANNGRDAHEGPCPQCDELSSRDAARLRAERDAALVTLARIQAVAADVDQDGGHSGPTLARHILNIIGGEA